MTKRTRCTSGAECAGARRVQRAMRSNAPILTSSANGVVRTSSGIAVSKEWDPEWTKWRMDQVSDHNVNILPKIIEAEDDIVDL